MSFAVMYQSKRLVPFAGSGIRSILRMSALACLQNGGFKPLPVGPNAPAQPKEARRRWSTHSQPREQSVFLPGNIVRSPMPDVEIPDVSFHEFMFRKLDEFKTRPALTEFETGKSYTYGDVKEKTIKAASALTRLGYRKGDTFLVFSTNQNDYVVLGLAAACLGITLTTANPSFTAGELAVQIIDSNPQAIFVLPALAQTAKNALQKKEVLHKPKGLFAFGQADGFQPFAHLLDDDGLAFPDVSIQPKEDILVMPYSSGTTGRPKGVMLTHHNIIANFLQSKDLLFISPGDNFMGFLPMFHILGLVFIQNSVLLSGAQLHFLTRFEPESFLKCMQDCKIDTVTVVPPVILFLAKHPLVSNFDLSHLTRVRCGAAPLGKELIMEFKSRFSHNIAVDQGFGMTETALVNLDTKENFPSVGPLACNTYGKIIDLDTGEALGPHQEGEYCIKGPQIMKGYNNNKKATDETIDSDGWLRTGDIAYYDEEGLFYVTDRLKDIIKYKAHQVAPAELESLLLGHPAVQDVAVVGVADVAAGELPRAFVVKKPDSNVVEEDLIKYVEENASQEKRLRGGVKFVNEIPTSPSGKILRRLLKAE